MISQAIKNSTQKPALMTHVVAGFPNLVESEAIVEMMADVADIIEIQIPFTDPVADGPTMQKCNDIALKNGTRVDDVLAMSARLSKKINTPLFLMTYYNIIFRRGVNTFCAQAMAAGIRGLIVPDFPIEEEDRDGFFSACQKHNLTPILVSAPLADEKRIKKLAPFARGFWYAVSRTGTTGAQKELSQNISAQAEMIRRHSDLPIAFAFGVSKRSHLQQIQKVAEIAVVGSAVQNIFLKGGRFEERLREAKIFLRSLRTSSVS